MSFPLIDNFDVRIKKPIDKRFTQENSDVDTAYQGLFKFNPSDEKYYKFIDGAFVPFFQEIEALIDDINTEIENIKIYQGKLNVKLFGAKGDGVTDDTLALNNAVASGAKEIYIPSGTYIITDRIKIENSGVRIFGDGKDSIIKGKNGTDTTYHYFAIDTTTALKNLHDITIEYLNLDGNKTNRGTTGTGNAIVVFSEIQQSYEVHHIKINRNYIHDFSGFSVWLCGYANGNVHDNEVCFNDIQDTFIGVIQSRSISAYIHNNYIRGSKFENITVDTGSNNCIVELNTLGDHKGGCGNIGFDYGNNVIIRNNKLDAGSPSSGTDPNSQHGITMNAEGGNSTGAIIEGNIIGGNLGNGFYCKYNSTTGFGSGSFIFANNFMYNNAKDIYVDLNAITGWSKIIGNNCPNGVTNNETSPFLVIPLSSY